MKSSSNACEFLKEKERELNFLDGEEKYTAIMDFGDEIPVIENHLITEQNKVPGCVSGVYISHEFIDGRIYFKGRSDSVIVKGYLSLLIQALSGLTSKDIENTEQCIETFVEKTNISKSLTPSRANALGNIFKMMKEKANEKQ